MNARVYFRGRNKDKFVLITNCPEGHNADVLIRAFARRKLGPNCDFFQPACNDVHEGKTLLTQIKYEDETI